MCSVFGRIEKQRHSKVLKVDHLSLLATYLPIVLRIFIFNKRINEANKFRVKKNKANKLETSAYLLGVSSNPLKWLYGGADMHVLSR